MSTIADKSTFVNFRERCEDKNTLNQKGTMYVGTGKTTDALGDGTKVSVTVATPQPEENALLVKDDSMEGGVNWKSVAEVLNDANAAGQITTAKVSEYSNKAESSDNATNVKETIQNIEVATFFKQKILELVYPVGSIYISVNEVSPQSFVGGTWIRWGNGRVLVGINENDTDFSTAEKEGGEKTHALTETEMPPHVHGERGALGTDYLVDYIFENTIPPYTPLSGVSFAMTETTKEKGGVVSTKSTGGGRSHNNLQPYITCYMWKRIE